MFNTPVADTPNNPDGIAGLPVDNFGLSGLHNSSGVAVDRVAYFRVFDFFAFTPGGPDLFAFVRVTGTERWKDKNSVFSDKQTSSLQILEVVWSRDDSVPESLSVTQSMYGGCCAGEPTNLLREGGVYFLPLGYWEDGEAWYVTGDLDVLFEVDDQGRIWSHSAFELFSQYDGKDASAVADVVTALTSDENFPAANTVFGTIVYNWGVLAEVTVLSEPPGANQWDTKGRYTFRLDNTLSVSPSEWYSFDVETGDEFTAVSYGHLEIGGRYLILLDPSEGGPYIDTGRIAVINSDGTITAIPVDGYGNIFDGYNGYTAGQMKEEAERAKAWRERHAK